MRAMARPIRIAAAGDIHCSPENRERAEAAFAEVHVGEPILRQVYSDTTAEVEAIESGLDAIEGCDHRIVLLHYAPTTTTLEGEPRVIWAFLGTDRMARPVGEHRPDVVLHGHAHRGTFEGRIGEVPVFNVAVEVMRRDFFVFQLGDDGLRAL